MSAFSDLRAQLVTDLAPMSVTVHPSWPEALTPPCAFIVPPLVSEFAQRGPNFGEYTVSLDLVILVDHDEPSVALATLEGLVQVALVNTANWSLSGVDSPAPVSVIEGGAEYLACIVHLSKPIPL